jgi:hypothetical protein
MMRRWGLSAAAFIASCVWSAPAFADQAFDIVQLACAPDMQYFSADRRYVDDITPDHEHRSKLFAVVGTDSLEAKPFDCAWNGHRIHVRSFLNNDVGIRAKKPACPWENGYSVRVLLDGRGVGCLEGNGPSASHRSLLTLNADGVSRDGSILVEQCEVEFSPVDAEKKISAEAGNLRCVTDILEKKRK